MYLGEEPYQSRKYAYHHQAYCNMLRLVGSSGARKVQVIYSCPRPASTIQQAEKCPERAAPATRASWWVRRLGWTLVKLKRKVLSTRLSGQESQGRQTDINESVPVGSWLRIENLHVMATLSFSSKLPIIHFMSTMSVSAVLKTADASTPPVDLAAIPVITVRVARRSEAIPDPRATSRNESWLVLRS